VTHAPGSPDKPGSAGEPGFPDKPGSDHPAATSSTPAHDLLLDERGRLCPIPVIALARAVAADPSPARVLLLADDPAAETDVPAWCAMRGRHLAWTGPAPDGHGRAYLVTARAGSGREGQMASGTGTMA